jgi:hypothetical protein
VGDNRHHLATAAERQREAPQPSHTSAHCRPTSPPLFVSMGRELSLGREVTAADIGVGHNPCLWLYHQLFGLDFLVDARGRVLFLEANPEPALAMYEAEEALLRSLAVTTLPPPGFRKVYSRTLDEAFSSLGVGGMKARGVAACEKPVAAGQRGGGAATQE